MREPREPPNRPALARGFNPIVRPFPLEQGPGQLSGLGFEERRLNKRTELPERVDGLLDAGVDGTERLKKVNSQVIQGSEKIREAVRLKAVVHFRSPPVQLPELLLEVSDAGWWIRRLEHPLAVFAESFPGFLLDPMKVIEKVRDRRCASVAPQGLTNGEQLLGEHFEELAHGFCAFEGTGLGGVHGIHPFGGFHPASNACFAQPLSLDGSNFLRAWRTRGSGICPHHPQ
jgi:hypothetical protein